MQSLSNKNGAQADSPSNKNGAQADSQSNKTQKIRVLLVDDQNFARQRLKAMLESQPGLEIVGKAENGAAAQKLVQSLQPNVVLMDLEMPEVSGIQASEEIVANNPDCKVIVLTIHESEEYVNQVLRTGAKGYVAKSASAEELTTAIRSVHNGFSYFGPGVLEKLNLAEPKSDEAEPDSADAKADDNSAEAKSEEETGIFREKSLERLSSPDRLDQLMHVVAPKNWLPLGTLGSLIIAGITWGFLGRIPVTVEGRGVVIHPSKVIPLQSKSAGQIVSLDLKVGDSVEKGDVIATVDQSSLDKQLKLAREKLNQLQGQNSDADLLQSDRSKKETAAIAEQGQTLQQRLKILKDLTPLLREKGLLSIRSERLTLETRLQKLRELTPTYEKRLATRQMLFEEGAISDDNLLQARQEYIENTTTINDAESQLKQLDVQEAEALQKYLANLNEVKDVQAQIQELDSKKATLAQENLTTSTNRIKEIQETKREIGKLEQQISSDGKVVSQHTGRVLEIATGPGEVLDAGTRIANLDVEDPSDRLVGITYFPIKDGKKVQSEMKIQITPQIVKRERFGGIIGNVTKVSAFPITKEAAAKVIGNPDVVEGLTSSPKEGLMQVSASLVSDETNISGYKWSSSSGPAIKISPGTTTVARVKLEERKPISYVIPILRSVSGIY